MGRKLVLSLEWTSYPSRDTETATLVRNYLRLNGIKVIAGSIHNAYYLIWKYRPDLVYITNIIGARINFKVACFCRSRNIKLVTGISEGDIKEHSISQMVWGHNSLKYPVESLILLWSKYQREKFIGECKVYNKIARVTGSAGADRYIISDFSKGVIDRRDYKLIVGIGCFNFRETIRNQNFNSNSIKESQILQSSDRDLFSKNLDDLVQRMPNVLFIAKLHPGGDRGLYGAGVEKASNRKNFKVFSKDSSISECIANSDVWMTYESNTAMEAWLLNKPTALLNPLGVNFPRSDFFKGQPNFATASDWYYALNSFIQNSELPGFKELEEERKKIFKKIIGWQDGFNHIRSGNEILNILSSKVSDPEIFLPSNLIPDWKERIKQLYTYFVTQIGLGKSKRRRWSKSHLNKFEERRMKEQLIFYKRLGKDWFEDLRNI